MPPTASQPLGEFCVVGAAHVRPAAFWQTAVHPSCAGRAYPAPTISFLNMLQNLVAHLGAAYPGAAGSHQDVYKRQGFTLLACATLALLNWQPMQTAFDKLANCWYKRK